MTAAALIARFDGLEPNPWSTEEKLAWLNAVERSLEEGVFARHKNTPVPHGELTGESVLHADAPHEGIYLWYLGAMHHLYAGDITRYNNDIALFQSAYREFIRATHRRCEPVGERLSWFA